MRAGTVYVGDCVEVMRSWPDECVQCVVTSPPYWGLRDYGTPGQLGLEPTPEEYVAKMVEVFREVRRVLRKDGTIWLNMGDCYAGYHGNSRVPDDEAPSNKPGYTKAHEYVFLLTKSARYYYDAEAVREDAADSSQERAYLGKRPISDRQALMQEQGMHGKSDTLRVYDRTGRNKRSVWEVATQPFPGAHFATFPEALVVPCIKAGTSEKGCCAECGSPWARVVDVSFDDQGRTTNGPRSVANREITAGFDQRLVRRASTTGWRATCDHTAATVPCVVLDPFAGSGTTLMVAQGQGRQFVGIELSPEYAQIAMQRIGMFARLAE